MATNPYSPIQQLIGHLSQQELVEFQQAVDYLTSMSDQRSIPEGSLTKVLASLSPNVRDAFETLSQTLDTPRMAPFQRKLSQQDYADSLGMDGDTTQLVKQRLEDEGITAGLQ